MEKMADEKRILATANPELAAEWHPVKNGGLTPHNVTAGSGKSVWWLYPYDDPKTGKHFDFEWEATVCDRNNGVGCPYLSGKRVWPGFNDLYTTDPMLAAEWHPVKNGGLTPHNVTAGSGKSVWWLYPYDDSKTGKHFDFEWEDVVIKRNKGYGCPYLSGKRVWPGFNDLYTTDPILAAEWHPVKNGDLTPHNITAGSEKRVWWLYPYDDPKTGKHFDFEWEATVVNRSRGTGCPFLSGNGVWPGFNDLYTINPTLADQWHPIKNGDLTPYDVIAQSELKAWWLYPYNDPKTGKHFDFEWEARVCERDKSYGCPYLSGKRVWPGFNDLYTTDPILAAEWHPVRNGNLTPHDVSLSSNKTVWWLYPYDDPKTGRHFDFEWKASINSRSNGTGTVCPFLSGNGVWPGFNDLYTINPALADQWHPIKNGDLTPYDVTAGSGLKVWWLYPYDDPKTEKHFDFEWEATVANRSKGEDCPFLSGNGVWPGFNDLYTINPTLADQWHPIKNGDLTPYDVTAGSGLKVWWLYPYDDPKTGRHFDFEWKASINSRSNGTGTVCPFLSGNGVWPGFNDLYTINPTLADQWHPIKNGDLTPYDVTAGSGLKVWWLYPYDDPKTGKHFDFEWEATVEKRSKGEDCPFLSGNKVLKGFNDLESVDPLLAMEWHPEKNRKKTPSNIYCISGQKCWWKCSICGHVWRTSIASRRRGVNCPKCHSDDV